MSELDVQLESVIRYILEQGMLSGHGFLEHDGIAQSIQSIKQAFTDAGYIDGHDYLHFLTERHKPSEALQAYMDKVEAANIPEDSK